MRIRPLCILGALLVPLMSSPACAQTFYGPQGLLIHPTAQFAPDGTMELYAAYLTQKSGPRINEWVPLSLSYTAGGRLQVGANVFIHGGDQVDTHTHLGGFARYLLAPDRGSAPAVALAAGFLSADGRQNQVAGVLSHRFTREGREIFTGHAGVQWVRSHGRNALEDTGGFMGLSIPLSRNFRLVGEMATKLRFERKAASAIGIQWSGGSGLDIAVGYVNSGRSDQNRFFVGVGYPLGGGR